MLIYPHGCTVGSTFSMVDASWNFESICPRNERGIPSVHAWVVNMRQLVSSKILTANFDDITSNLEIMGYLQCVVLLPPQTCCV